MNPSKDLLYFAGPKRVGFVRIRQLNLLYKLGISLFLIFAAFILQSISYNVVLILLCVLVLITQKIRVIRFRSLYYALFLFLLSMFLFRVFSGYGRILVHLPASLTITTGGLLTATIAVEQVLLIFLLTGLALYSSSRQEVYYYLAQLPGNHETGNQFAIRFGRISLFVLYLLPQVFKRGQELKQMLKQQAEKRPGIRHRIRHGIDSIGLFAEFVLRRAEVVYPEFADQHASRQFEPIRVLNLRHMVPVALLLMTHACIFWVWFR